LGLLAPAASLQASDQDTDELAELLGDSEAEMRGGEDTGDRADQADDESASGREAAPLDVIRLPEPTPPVPAETRGAKRSLVEEIVVTAQRREENIQDVPISITVFDQKQISNANMTNSADLAKYTPSLQVNTRFGPDNAAFTIRGFTQDLRTTASVAVYFAEVVAPRGQSTQTSGDGAGPGALFDLQNIQVLKGPQGTVFGRNTTGGAILLVPQRPTDEFSGHVEFSPANFDGLRGQGVLNLPVSDSLKLRFGVDHNQRDGILNNVSGIGVDQLGDVDYTSGRLSAVWDVTEAIENYTILSMVNSDSNGYTAQLFDCSNPVPRLTDPSQYDIDELIASLPALLTGAIDPVNPVPGVPLGSPLALLTFQSCEQQLADQAAAGQNGFYDVVSTVKTAVTRIKERRLINTTTWEVAEGLRFRNIFAYSHLYTENGSSIFGTYFPDPTDASGARELTIGVSIVDPDIPVTSQQSVVEELQLQGDSMDRRLVWQAGAYYEKSMPDGWSGNRSSSLAYCDVKTLEGDPSQFDCFDPFQGMVGGVLAYRVKTNYLNQALYAQGTFDFLDSLSATLGLRYTWDETEAEGIKTLYRYALSVQQAPTVTVQTPSLRSTAPTGMLEFNYHPWPEVMTYAKYTRGYRQGNTNITADPGVDFHEPETVDTFEIGLKSSFDGPVPGRFNVAIFDNTLTDMQLQAGYVSTTSGPTSAIFNAGKGKSRGAEVEAFFQPFEFLSTSLSYSFLDTELVESAEFCERVRTAGGAIAGFTCTPIAEVGDELPYAPDHSAVANVNVFLPVPERLGLTNLGLTYAYTGHQRVAGSSQTPHAVLDDFGIFNANLSWDEVFGSSLSLVAFGTNLLDRQYVTYVSGTYRPLGIDSRALGQPRMFGARLRYNF
jgi:outer membrane receptor protein involved in Fe transport